MYAGRSMAIRHIRRNAEMCQYPCADSLRRNGEPERNQTDTLRGMDYKNEIGRRIREARDAKGWTLGDLSVRTEDRLDPKRINAYENGVRMPKPAEVAILANALGKRAAYLMALEDEMEERLLRNWRTLSERERMEIYRKVEAMSLTARDPVSDQVVEKSLPRAPKTVAAKSVKKHTAK